MNSAGNDEFGKWMCFHWDVKCKKKETGIWFMKILWPGNKQGRLVTVIQPPDRCCHIMMYSRGPGSG